MTRALSRVAGKRLHYSCRQAALKIGVLSMKNIFRSLAIIAIAAVIGLSSTSCSGKSGGSKNITSAEALKEYLDKQPANSSDKPIKVAMKANDEMLKSIGTIIKSAGKYVSLDLSGSPLKTIPDAAFYENEKKEGCSTLVNIIIPNGVTSIGQSAFLRCTSLASVTIGNSVTSIEQEAFGGCTRLASVNIPDSVTRIGISVFAGCTSLASITIPDSVTSIGNRAFQGCTSLASVTIPDSVTEIRDYAFFGCTSLASITIPNSVTSIGERAFQGCTILASITLPDSVTGIWPAAFSGCTSLSSVTIGNSVPSIGPDVFSDCASLTRITIPDSVKGIWYDAFSGCSSLASVTFRGTISPDGFLISLNRTAFPGDLRAKFFATDRTNGTPGTYTRASGGTTWTRQ
jgi:hypothetical protein